MQPGPRIERERPTMTAIAEVTASDIRRFAQWNSAPVVSAYIPVERGHPADELTARLHSAARTARHELEERFGMRGDAAEMVEPLKGFDRELALPYNGVAIFLSADRIERSFLHYSPEPLVVVAEEPWLLPMLPVIADHQSFWLLTLSQHHVRLWKGDELGIVRFRDVDLPSGFEDVTWYVRRETGLNRHGSGAMHGTGGDRDLHKTDLVRYMQAIDRALVPVLADSRDPLVVAGVGYEAAMFICETHYRNVVQDPITGNPDLLDERTLHDRTVQHLAPITLKRTESVVELLRSATGTGLVQTGVEEIGKAMATGSVATLFIGRAFASSASMNSPVDLHVGSLVNRAMVDGVKVALVPDDALSDSGALAALLRY